VLCADPHGGFPRRTNGCGGGLGERGRAQSEGSAGGLEKFSSVHDLSTYIRKHVARAQQEKAVFPLPPAGVVRHIEIRHSNLM
jgi:hypothetical protein